MKLCNDHFLEDIPPHSFGVKALKLMREFFSVDEDLIFKFIYF